MRRNTAIVNILNAAEINYIVTNEKVGVFLKGEKLNLALRVKLSKVAKDYGQMN